MPAALLLAVGAVPDHGGSGGHRCGWRGLLLNGVIHEAGNLRGGVVEKCLALVYLNAGRSYRGGALNHALGSQRRGVGDTVAQQLHLD